MKCTLRNCLAALLALWLAVGAWSNAVAEGPQARLEARDCWFTSGGMVNVDCAVLFVPARWDQSSDGDRSKTFRLAVSRFRASPPSADLPPVFYFAGRAGAAGVPAHESHARVFRRLSNSLFAGRDVVVLDQRGTGRSYPRLDCAAAEDPHVWAGLAASEDQAGRGFARLRDALQACLAQFRDLGRDLGAFSSRASAADVDALRAALGYEQIVLFGQSYGSRLALAVMAQSPEIVAAAVLDSVLPPQAASGRLSTRHFSAALTRLLRACASHASCGKAYPELPGRLAKTLARLYVEPVALEIQNLKGLEPLYAKIDDVALLQIIFSEMYNRPGLQTLPMMIAGFAKGEHWRLRSHAENHFYGRENPDLATGLTLSLECSEEFTLSSRQSQRSGAADLPFLTNWGTSLWDQSPCHIWPAAPAASSDSAAVVSSAPTLLLAGAFDPVTPLELAELTAEGLANSHLFIIPNGGHRVIGDSDCSENILVDFLANPGKRPNPDCLHKLPQPAFVALGGD